MHLAEILDLKRAGVIFLLTLEEWYVGARGCTQISEIRGMDDGEHC